MFAKLEGILQTVGSVGVFGYDFAFHHSSRQING